MSEEENSNNEDSMGSSLKELSVSIGIFATIITLLFNATSLISSDQNQQAELELKELSFYQETKNEFRNFVIANQSFLYADSSDFADSLARMKQLMYATFPQDIVDDFLTDLYAAVPMEKRVTVKKEIENCFPFPNRKIYSSQKLYVESKDSAVWFVVVASLPDLPKAKRYISEYRGKNPNSTSEFKIYKASDRNSQTTYAVTIGNNLTYSAGQQLVCEARTILGFRSDSYMWANPNWQQMK